MKLRDLLPPGGWNALDWKVRPAPYGPEEIDIKLGFLQGEVSEFEIPEHLQEIDIGRILATLMDLGNRVYDLERITRESEWRRIFSTPEARRKRTEWLSANIEERRKEYPDMAKKMSDELDFLLSVVD